MINVLYNYLINVMKKFEVSYVNIVDEVERKKTVITGSQYKAMQSIANEDPKNIITAVTLIEDYEDKEVS